MMNYTWRDGRYELSAFRFLTGQIRRDLPLAGPNWVFELSRRWQYVTQSGLRLFAGLGGAYKNDTDDINGSHLNFAEQLGWRSPRRVMDGQVEFSARRRVPAGNTGGPDLLPQQALFIR